MPSCYSSEVRFQSHRAMSDPRAPSPVLFSASFHAQAIYSLCELLLPPAVISRVRSNDNFLADEKGLPAFLTFTDVPSSMCFLAE